MSKQAKTQAKARRLEEIKKRVRRGEGLTPREALILLRELETLPGKVINEPILKDGCYDRLHD